MQCTTVHCTTAEWKRINELLMAVPRQSPVAFPTTGIKEEFNAWPLPPLRWHQIMNLLFNIMHLKTIKKCILPIDCNRSISHLIFGGKSPQHTPWRGEQIQLYYNSNQQNQHQPSLYLSSMFWTILLNQYIICVSDHGSYTCIIAIEMTIRWIALSVARL